MKNPFISRGLRGITLLLAAVAMSILSGCGVNKPLVLMDQSYQLKPDSIAVIAGSNDSAEINMAKALTEELQKRSKFKVISQEEISKRIPKYPYEIKTAAPKDPKKPVWFAPDQKKKLKSIQSRLKAKYLFVVWSTNMSMQTVTYSNGGGSTTYFITFLGNMIENPNGKVVSFTHLDKNDSPSCLKFNFFRSSNYFIDSMMKKAAKQITDRIVTLTGKKVAK